MLQIDCIVTGEVATSVSLDPAEVMRFAEVVLRENGVVSCSLNIVFVDDDTMTDLNSRYKGRDGTTDVLTFMLSERDDETRDGEIYISPRRVREQSGDYIVSAEDEMVRVLTHGLLHFAGHIHDTESQMQAMEALTARFMKEYDHTTGEH